MQIAEVLLGCLLLGQGANQHSMRPPEMVAEAILLPAQSTLTGQPLSLLDALGSTPDRRRQLEAVHAYWRLAQAVAEYHFCLDYVQGLEKLKDGAEKNVSLRLIRTSATAQLREAEIVAVRTQHELAELINLPHDAPRPLAADRPHVGAYRTSFNELFAGRTPPEPARLAERILPLQHQVIDDRTAAVQAAEDALVAVEENYQSGRANAATVASCGRELLRRRQAFIRSVCDYNRNIANYGFNVVGPAASPQTLVAILIGPTQRAAAPPVSGGAGAIQAAGANEPITNRTQQPSWNASGLTPMQPKNEPTLAPPREGWRANEPTPAPPRDGFKPVGKNEPTLAPPRDDVEKELPETTKDQLVPIDSPPMSLESPTSSVPPTPSGVVPMSVNKPLPLENEQAIGKSATVATPLYPALVDTSPALRAKQLTTALHWDRSLPKGAGKPISLAECLLRAAGGDRRATVEAYWLLRRRAAEYQWLVEQADLFDEVVPVVLKRRNTSDGAAEMVRLHAARLAVHAARSEAHVALVEAQYALALQIGTVADADWPLASTVPHSGSYLLKLDAQPDGLVDSWPVRRLVAMIPALSEDVRQRTMAVVEADAARVATVEKYRTAAATISPVLESIAEQSAQTSAFLDALLEYNRAIAEYASTVLPPTTPTDKFVATLVVKP